MKYEAEIDGKTLALELDERDGQISATVDGRPYEIGGARPEEGAYLLFVGDTVYEARVSSATNALQVSLRGKTFTATIIDRKHRRGGADHSDTAQKQLIAPMPGKVVRLLLEVGDEVAAGQGIVVVEAMKMQNEIKSPKAGRVLELRVGEGDTVAANQILAVIE
jgi:biotin carboxyl carrier protein